MEDQPFTLRWGGGVLKDDNALVIFHQMIRLFICPVFLKPYSHLVLQRFHRPKYLMIQYYKRSCKSPNLNLNIERETLYYINRSVPSIDAHMLTSNDLNSISYAYSTLVMAVLCKLGFAPSLLCRCLILRSNSIPIYVM